ncbi:hypothetical protein [Rappaport israeli]|uniref:hypothetical protein n=1 Tax=Rappaport israeli TaxID=1839807 RepID=UPI000B165217|nr:hypothetical protein [Rappaport israeli]
MHAMSLRKILLPLLILIAFPSPLVVAQNSIDCQEAQSSIFTALRKGKLETIQNYTQQCTLPKEDERGFASYDLALLSADKDTLAWLKDKGYQNKTHSVSLLKYIQTGLRFLNF